MQCEKSLLVGGEGYKFTIASYALIGLFPTLSIRLAFSFIALFTLFRGARLVSESLACTPLYTLRIRVFMAGSSILFPPSSIQVTVLQESVSE